MNLLVLEASRLLTDFYFQMGWDNYLAAHVQEVRKAQHWLKQYRGIKSKQRRSIWANLGDAVETAIRNGVFDRTIEEVKAEQDAIFKGTVDNDDILEMQFQGLVEYIEVAIEIRKSLPRNFIAPMVHAAQNKTMSLSALTQMERVWRHLDNPSEESDALSMITEITGNDRSVSRFVIGEWNLAAAVSGKAIPLMPFILLASVLNNPSENDADVYFADLQNLWPKFHNSVFYRELVRIRKQANSDLLNCLSNVLANADLDGGDLTPVSTVYEIVSQLIYSRNLDNDYVMSLLAEGDLNLSDDIVNRFATILENADTRRDFRQLALEGELFQRSCDIIIKTPVQAYQDVLDFVTKLTPNYNDGDDAVTFMNTLISAEDCLINLTNQAAIEDQGVRESNFVALASQASDWDFPIASLIEYVWHPVRLDHFRNGMLAVADAANINSFNSGKSRITDKIFDTVNAELERIYQAGDIDALKHINGYLQDFTNNLADPAKAVQLMLLDWDVTRDIKRELHWLVLNTINTNEFVGVLNRIETARRQIADALALVHVMPQMFRQVALAHARGDTFVLTKYSEVMKNRHTDVWAVFQEFGQVKTDDLAKLVQDKTQLKRVRGELDLLTTAVENACEDVHQISDFCTFVTKISDAALKAIKDQPTKRGHFDAVIARQVEWLSRLAHSHPSDHKSMQEYLNEDFTPFTTHVDRLKTFNSDFHSGDFLAYVHTSKRRTSAFRHAVLDRCLSLLNGRINLEEDALQSPEIEYALLMFIDLIPDILRNRVQYADLTGEWPSKHMQSWAKVDPVDMIGNVKKKIHAIFTELQDYWFGTNSENPMAGFSKLMENPDWHLLGWALLKLNRAPDQIMGALIERLPKLMMELGEDNTNGPIPDGFTDAHKLDFNFHNELGEPKLSSIVAQEMILELINPGSKTITLGKPIDLPDVKDMACHFALRFRAGTLIKGNLQNITLIAPHTEHGNWQIVGRQSRQIGAAYIDELLIKGPQGLSIKPGEPLHLVFTEMQGASTGSRTTRTLLIHQGLTAPDGDMAPGHREKLLSVVNEIPSRSRQVYDLPIEVEMISSDVIIADAVVENGLRIALTSMAPPASPRPVTFATFHEDSGQRSWRRSKIVVSIDVADPDFKDEMDWALCAKGQVSGIKASLRRQSGGDKWAQTFAGQGTRAEWVFSVPREFMGDDLTLPRRKSLELKLEGLISSMPEGPAYIDIQCLDFPGFPDRHYRVRVQKVLRTAPLGTVMAYAGSELPAGWLWCHGGAVPPSAPYNDLRAMLSHLDGTLPNMTARTVIGAGPKVDTVSNDKSTPFQDKKKSTALLTRGGEWDQPPHTHPISETIEKNEYVLTTNAVLTVPPVATEKLIFDVDIPKVPASTGESTYDEKITFHNNVQPYLALNYIIKY